MLFIISGEKVSGMGEGTCIERCPLQYLVKTLFGKAREFACPDTTENCLVDILTPTIIIITTITFCTSSWKE